MNLGIAILVFVASYFLLKTIAEANHEHAFIFWAALTAFGVYLIV